MENTLEKPQPQLTDKKKEINNIWTDRKTALYNHKTRKQNTWKMGENEQIIRLEDTRVLIKVSLS